MKTTRGIGMLPVIALGVGLFLAWASLFTLDQTVRAQGQIIPGARTQVIQAVDGGVLAEIRVQEGDAVKKGQVLAVLEMDRAQASFDETQARVAALQVAIARAEAEAAGRTPAFGGFQKRFPNLVAAQQALFEQRQRSLEEGLAAQQESLALAEDELGINERLSAKGDISQVELLRARRQVNEIKARMNELRNKHRQESRTEAAKLEDELAAQRYRGEERRNVLDHTEMTASLDGVVKYLRVNTVGGVLRAGDELMQISPTDGELLVEAKINPADIGQLRTGLPVSLRMDAFDYTIYGALTGELVYLSSDTLTEPGPGGQPLTYYRGRIRLSRDPAHHNPKLDLQTVKPGMTATIDIQVGQRSVLQYLTKPITRAFGGALNER